MSAEVSGVSLPSLEETIRYGLQGYSDVSEGTVEFDLDTACQLELTPDKPNSARSATTVKYLGEAAATMYVIAFAPEDGTGDNSLELGGIPRNGYPETDQVLPRSKRAMHSEAHLTLLSCELEDPNAEPIPFAGNLDLITDGFSRLRKLAELGQSNYREVIDGEAEASPTSTLTVGYHANIDLLSFSSKRFGDPHAVYNPHEELQVCAFIGVPEENVSSRDMDFLRALKPEEPEIIRS